MNSLSSHLSQTIEYGSSSMGLELVQAQSHQSLQQVKNHIPLHPPTPVTRRSYPRSMFLTHIRILWERAKQKIMSNVCNSVIATTNKITNFIQNYFYPKKTIVIAAPLLNEDVTIKIFNLLDFNSNFQMYSNVTLVCQLWNQCGSKIIITQNIKKLSICQEIIEKHPALKRLFREQLKKKIISIGFSIGSKALISYVVNTLSYHLGKSWNYTPEQMDAYNRKNEEGHLKRRWVDESGKAWLSPLHRDGSEIPYYPFEPLTPEWFNTDSQLPPVIAVGLKIYNVCNASAEIYLACQSLTTQHLINTDDFLKNSAYPIDYMEDDILKKYVCPLSKRVMLVPVKDKCGHLFDYLPIMKKIQQTGQCPIRRQRLLVDHLTFDLTTFKEIRKRVVMLQSSPKSQTNKKA